MQFWEDPEWIRLEQNRQEKHNKAWPYIQRALNPSNNEHSVSIEEIIKVFSELRAAEKEKRDYEDKEGYF